MLEKNKVNQDNQEPINSWEELFTKLQGGMSADFMSERIQPPLDVRESI